MSELLDRLHAAAHQRGQSYEVAAAAWATYKDYARRVADGLQKLARKPLVLSQGMNGPLTDNQRLR